MTMLKFSLVIVWIAYEISRPSMIHTIPSESIIILHQNPKASTALITMLKRSWNDTSGGEIHAALDWLF